MVARRERTIGRHTCTMDQNAAAALQYAQEHRDVYLHDLTDFLRIPSISTDPSFAGEVARAADWLVNHMQSIGITARAVPTGGHPVVVGECVHDPTLPTVLVYGHYDVQPPDPIELWDSPPFEPMVREGALFARGSSDDKGQLMVHLNALEAYAHTAGRPPVNLKYILEGEEESGSGSIPAFLDRYAKELTADVVLLSDTTLFAPGVPSLTYGLRGLAYVEVTLIGPDRDLHSGTYGGAIENPINALCRLVAGLHDNDHRISVDGFYDDVRDVTPQERAAMRALPFDAAAWASEVGVGATRTEAGYSVLEASTARPTLDCNGIWGGYTGKGAKTVLPSRAGAKISTRLVPDQEPDDIIEKLRAHCESRVPGTMRLEFRKIHTGRGVLVDTESAPMEAASQALEAIYGVRPHLTRIGGSIPIVADFKERLGLDSVLMGFGLDSDAIHSPNEHFGLDRFDQGTAAVIHFLSLYGKIGDRR